MRVWLVRDYSQACSRTRFSLMLLDNYGGMAELKECLPDEMFDRRLFMASVILWRTDGG